MPAKLISTNSPRAVPLNARGQHFPQSLEERGIRGTQTTANAAPKSALSVPDWVPAQRVA